ncbi:MAG: squalene/phytoene synthase family protein [Akkermansia sp.]
MQGYDSLLASVSRSFYLSIHFLPKCMRPAVSVAYLLARGTDSVADTSSEEISTRIAVLEGMGRLVAGERERVGSGDGVGGDECLRLLSNQMSLGQAHLGERALLARFGECLSFAESLSEEQLALVRKVLQTIIEGQLWDLSYFISHDAVLTAGDTELYAYRVAGCVGEFWTEMSRMCLGEKFAILPASEMIPMGIHFGQGLQLVNILRDREEDAQRGRRYLPRELPLEEWLFKARSWLDEGIRYASALRNRRLRFATLLPARLGLLTLDLIEQDLKEDASPMMGVKRKIGRPAVRREMLKALWFAWRRPRVM